MKKLSNNFLADLLNLGLSNRHVFSLLLSNLKDIYIHDEDYREIWKSMKRFFYSKDTIPTAAYLIQKLTNDDKKGKNNQAIDYLGEIKNSPIPDETVTLTAFEEYIKQNMFVEFYDKMGEEYNKQNKQKAFDLFIEKSAEFNNFSLVEEDFVELFGGFKERSEERMMRQYSSNIQQIPTGWNFIDAPTEGGLWTGETELWLGDSGVGKSKLLVSRAISTARMGKNVLHIQAEGTEQQCLDNFDACWTGFRYMDLKLGSIESIKLKQRMKLAEKMLKQNKGEVIVKSVEKFGGASLADLRRWVMEVIKKYGSLSHLVVDYLELLNIGDGKKYDYEGGDRAKMNKLARGFKDICVEFNLLGTTAAQSNSVSPELLKQPDFVMTRYNIGKHKRFVEPFSYFYTINQSPDEKKQGVVRIYEDKLREHQSGATHVIAQNLGCSRFYDRKKTIEYKELNGYFDDEEDEDGWI